MPLHRADLNSSDIVSNVRKILTASGQPKVSAILVQAYENDVTLHVTADSSSGDRSTAGGGQTQRLGPDILGGAVHPDNSQEENQKNNAVYMVGSYTKVISNFTMSELMKQTNPKTERTKLVYDLVRHLGHQADAGGIEIDCLKGNPQIGELMCNVNSFPPMNEYCFAPDGTFLWTIEEFLRIAPKITLDYFKNRERAWFEYSNGNHILIGCIIKNMFAQNGLEAAMRALVFERFGMMSASIDSQRLVELRANHIIERGIQVSADGEQFDVDPNNLMDSAAAGTVGLSCSLNDLAKFNKGLLERLDGAPKYDLTENDVGDFLKGDYSLIGNVADLYKAELQNESPTRYLHSEKHEPERLGRPTEKMYQVGKALRQFFADKPLKAPVHQKAGYVDGFSCSTYLLPTYRAALIVLSNSTGPRDVVHYVGRYLLAEILDLSLKDGVVDWAIKEGEKNANTLRELEQKYLVCHNSKNLYNEIPDHLAGTYVHTRYEQKIVITAAGEAYVGGAGATSRPMKLMRVPDKEDVVRIRMLIDRQCLPIEVWSSWRNMDLSIQKKNGRYLLSRREGEDIYEKLDGE